MRSARKFVVIAILAGAPTWARADAVSPDTCETALAEGRFGDAYALGLEAAETIPSDPRAWYCASATSFTVARREEAERFADRGLERFPDNVDLLGVRAAIRLARDDEDGARSDAERALELDPMAADAQLVAAELIASDRATARLGGEDPGLEVGSPEHFVDQFCAEVAGGARAARLTHFFDLEVLEQFDPAKRNPYVLAQLIQVFLRKMHDGDARGLGWYVEPEWEEVDGRFRVTVEVPAVITLREENRRVMEAGYADARTRDAIDPGIRAVLDGLPEVERRAFLDRLVGTTQRVRVPVVFELVRSGDGYRIADITRYGMSMKQMTAFGAVVSKGGDSDESLWRSMLRSTELWLTCGFLMWGIYMWVRRRGGAR